MTKRIGSLLAAGIALAFAGNASAGQLQCSMETHSAAGLSGNLTVGIGGSFIRDISVPTDPCTGKVGGPDGFDVLAFLRGNGPADERFTVDENGLFYSDEDGEVVLDSLRVTDFVLGGNVDPQIIYGLSIIDFGAPTVFSFVFSLPVVGVPGANTVDASSSGSTSDAGMDGTLVTPTATNIQVNNLFNPGSINAGVDVGDTCSVWPPTVSGACGSDAAGPIAGPGGPVISMETRVGFTGPGGGDTVGLTGRFRVIPNAVPAPGVLGLLGLGIIGAGLLRRCRG